MLTCAEFGNSNDANATTASDDDATRRVFVSLALEFGANFHAAYPTTTSV
jgi:hypothetical protein